jgi:hypothetical protein
MTKINSEQRLRTYAQVQRALSDVQRALARNDLSEPVRGSLEAEQASFQAAVDLGPQQYDKKRAEFMALLDSNEAGRRKHFQLGNLPVITAPVLALKASLLNARPHVNGRKIQWNIGAVGSAYKDRQVTDDPHFRIMQGRPHRVRHLGSTFNTGLLPDFRDKFVAEVRVDTAGKRITVEVTGEKNEAALKEFFDEYCAEHGLTLQLTTMPGKPQVEALPADNGPV